MIKEQIEELLKENTWASVKLNDFPIKLRHTILQMPNMCPVKDMVEKEVVINLMNDVKQETIADEIKFLNLLVDNYMQEEDGSESSEIKLILKRREFIKAKLKETK